MAFLLNPKHSDGSCFAIIDREMILRKDGSMLDFDDLCILKNLQKQTDFFEEKTFHLCALGLTSKENIPEQYIIQPIRQSFASLSDVDETFRLARAKALISWRQSQKFCSCCGARLVEHETLTCRVCPTCKKQFFPRIEPCIIVLVYKGDEILLVRHVQRNQDVYACIAGFIEVGETAEHAVVREVKEESGIIVKNVQYKGSQSWPFPDQLMLAFTAEYESGDIHVQQDEISEARWFKKNQIPATPPPGSVAYRLIHNLI